MLSSEVWVIIDLRGGEKRRGKQQQIQRRYDNVE